MEGSERELTEEEHLNLWDEEVTVWIKKQPSRRKKFGMLLLMWVLGVVGIVLVLATVTLFVYLVFFAAGMDSKLFPLVR